MEKVNDYNLPQWAPSVHFTKAIDRVEQWCIIKPLLPSKVHESHATCQILIRIAHQEKTG